MDVLSIEHCVETDIGILHPIDENEIIVLLMNLKALAKAMMAVITSLLAMMCGKTDGQGNERWVYSNISNANNPSIARYSTVV